jgi:hypothetical protein
MTNFQNFVTNFPAAEGRWPRTRLPLEICQPQVANLNFWQFRGQRAQLG